MLIFLYFLAIAALAVAEIEAQENATIRFDLEDRSWTTSLHEKCPELKCSLYDGIGMMLDETVICCHKKCKTCGGDNCGKKMKKNNKDNCCAGRIVAKSKYCGRNRKAPCVIPEWRIKDNSQLGRSAPKADCTWGEWTIGNCNATCGGGIRTDTREKKTVQRGGGYCDETYSREVACNTQACPPIDCSWGNWTTGTCSVTCGVGIRIDTREKSTMESNGGRCEGCETKIEECSKENCPVDCNWSEWSSGECSESCGGGFLRRTRNAGGEHKGGSKECSLDQTLTENCNTHECPVDCTWSEWEYVTKYCNCGRGFRDKRRIEYKEKYGGKPCDGEPETTEPCKEEECPADREMCPDVCQCKVAPRRGEHSAGRRGLSFYNGYCFYWCGPEGYCQASTKAKKEGKECRGCRMAFLGY